MLKDVNTNRECVTTPEAAKRSGLSTNHLSRLLRTGVLEGVQLGREWLVYIDSLEKYVATPHKPGPKGPMKKGKQPTEAPNQQEIVQQEPESIQSSPPVPRYENA